MIILGIGLIFFTWMIAIPLGRAAAQWEDRAGYANKLFTWRAWLLMGVGFVPAITGGLLLIYYL